ncbi:histidine utilization repressor [Thalassotalea sp. LPB0316]|uniref:histidine utilization repressor n=1 Tax=Thalassotalea sp. LPB0316 TaxID=2769490 RepID=UPI0018685ECE|nr:histidine utilization repressor [Thalassotalea sp. LPB0316]QOL25434.1 histidine utilization repressor [Thalassotalea sp. LPB0316]
MSVPKFVEIKQYIFKQIESGEWPANYKVPSENELADRFSVSRMTARRALQELTDENVLFRTQGVGSFVASFKSQSSLLEIKNIADEIRERGHQYHSQLVQLIEVELPASLVPLFGLKANAKVFYSEILHFENNQPIQLEQRYVNADLAPHYLVQDFGKTTPHEYLSHVAPLTEATHEIEAIIASSKINQLLAISSQQPCLQVKRRTWSSSGVVSFAILTSPGDKYRLGGHLTF